MVGGATRCAESGEKIPSSSSSSSSSSASLLLSSLELSDTKVYEPQIRALLGTASHKVVHTDEQHGLNHTRGRVQGVGCRTEFLVEGVGGCLGRRK